MKKLIHLVVALCSVTTVHLAAEESAVKIGGLFCLSSECAEFGTNAKKGVELAIEEINNAGGLLGKKVLLITQDSRDSTPRNTVTAFKNLSQDKDIHLIIGPTWTIGGIAIAPHIANNKNIIVTSPSVGVKDFNEAASNIFNTWPHDEKGTRKLAQFALSKGWKKAAILGAQEPWVKTQTKIFIEEFTTSGGVITTTLEPDPSSRELKGEALLLKNGNPDVIFIANYQSDVITKELRTLKFSPHKLVILMEKDRVKAADGALEGTFFAMYEKPSTTFREAFIKKFSQEPSLAADTAYDAMMLYAKAITDTKSFDVKIIKDALHGIRDYKGASGTFSIDEKGAVNKAPVLWKIKGLEYVPAEN